MEEVRFQTPFERWQQEPIEPLALDEAENGVRARIYGEPEYVTVLPRGTQLTLADELDVRHSGPSEVEAPEVI